ncbi:MAG: hypothetical protein WA951_13705 [Leeuwenhoekiella sp.]
MALSKRSKWWLMGGAGAILFGSGLSLALEASHWKHDGSDWYYWVLGGTAGIGIALSGVVVLIKAGILKREIDRKD